MLYIGSDYAGYQLKEKIKLYLEKHQMAYIDVGTESGRARNDFTEFIPPVVTPIQKNSRHRGILICGTGYGMVIGANRFRGIRATLAHSVRQAKYARTHDNANILVFSAWQTSAPLATRILGIWLQTPFDALPRRIRRFKKIDTWHR